MEHLRKLAPEPQKEGVNIEQLVTTINISNTDYNIANSSVTAIEPYT